MKGFCRFPFALAAFGFASAAVAATWTGGGADDNWSTAANWGGSAPAAGAALVFDGASRTTPVNDFAAGTSFGDITFAADAAPFTLTGQALATAGTVRNLSGKTQAFGLPLTAKPGIHLNAEIGDLELAAPLTLDAASSGQYFYKNGPGELVFTGVHELANPNPRFVLQNGTLRFAAGSVFHWTGPAASYRFSLDVQPNAPDRKLGFVVEEGADVVFPNITVYSANNANLSGAVFDVVVDGCLSIPNTDTDFGDQAGKSISLTVGPKGSFYSGWASMGTRTPMTTTVNGGVFAALNMAFGRQSSGGDRPGANTFILNSGYVVVSNYFGTMSTTAPSVENRIVFGDGTRDGAVFESVPFTRASAGTGKVLLAFDGAEIVTRRATGNNADFFGGTESKEVLAGGFVFRADHAVDVLGELSHGADLPAGVLDGGITKRGPEALTFRAQPTVTGPIRVEEGRLSFHTPPPTTQSALFMAPGSMINIRNNMDATDVLTAPEMTIGSASGANVQMWFNLAKVGGTCLSDRIRIPSGGYVGRVNFLLGDCVDGGSFGEPGEYVLIEYADTYPQLADLGVSGLATGCKAELVHDAANRRILVRITSSATPEVVLDATWASPTGGTYGESANWTPGEPASVGGAKATFGTVATEDAVVRLEAPKILSTIVFDNAAHAYTLAGESLRIGNSSGTVAASVSVNAGHHVVSVPVELTSTTTVTRLPETSLAFTGGFSSGKPVRHAGAGTTRMSGTGTGFAQTVMDGTLVFDNADWRIENSGNNRREALETRPSAKDAVVAVDILGSRLSLSGMLVGSGSGYDGTSLVTLSGSTVACDSEVTLGNRTGGTVALDVRDGSSLVSYGNSMNVGVNGTVTVNVSNATLRALQLTQGGYGLGLPGATARGGTSEIHVRDGGLLEVTGYFDWISDNAGQPHTLAVHAGGRAVLPPTSRVDGSTGTATIALEGGTLAFRAGGAERGSADDMLHGTDVLALGAAGGAVDTAGLDATVRCGLTQTAASSAGFTKTGPGRLALLGGISCDAPVAVEQGELAVSAPPAGALRLADGAVFTYTNAAADQVSLKALSLGNAAVLALDAGDTVALEGGLSLSGAPVLRLRGSPAAGTREFLRAASISGDVSAWQVVCDGLGAGMVCDLVQDGGTVRLVVSDVTSAASRWSVDADGFWQDAANWSTETAPAGAGAQAVVDTAFTAPRTLTLPAGGVAVDTAVFAAAAETRLEGGPLAANLLQAGGAGATLAAPLAFGADPLAVELFGGASLVLAANIPAGALDVAGMGELVVAATNAAAAVVADGATLQLAEAGRQTGAVVLNGGTLAATATRATVASDVALAAGARLEARTDATLELTGAVAGDVPLRKTGAGTVVVASPFDGTAEVVDGLLEMASLPTGGVRLGRGGFRTTGGGELVSLVGSSERAGVSLFQNDADVTASGPVEFMNTALVKRGAGTLRLTGPGMELHGPVQDEAGSDQNGKIAFGPHAAQPGGCGIHALVVAEGTVVLDNPAAVHNFDSLSVGRWTTDESGAETEGHLVVRNGSLNGYIGVGRGNGGATGGPCASSVRVEGGTLNLSGISMGHSAGRPDYRAAPLFEVAGGDVTSTAQNPLNIGESQGADCTFRQTGGTVRFRSGNVVVGNYAPGGNATFELLGGTMTIDNNLNLGASDTSTGTVHLAEGARLDTRMLVVGAGTGIVRFDGGTLGISVGPLTNLDAVVEAGGAVIEVPTTRVTSNLRFRRGAGAGGFVKRGPGDLFLSLGAEVPADDYVGPVRLEEGSMTVRSARAPFPVDAAFTGCAGSRLVLSDAGTVRHTVRLGSADLAGTVVVRPGDRLEVAGDLVFRDGAQVELQDESSSAALATPGTYALFAYAGAAPDISELSVANPVDGFVYAFAAADGLVTVTLSAGAGAAANVVWKTDADGVWTDGSNWTGGTAPTGAVEARFLSAATADRTVSVDGDVAAGGLLFSNAKTYTLAGSGRLALGGGVSGVANVESANGTHRVEVPVALDAPAQVKGGGNLVFAAGVTGDHQLTKTGTGRLALGGTSTAPVALREGTLDASGGDVAGQVAVSGGRISADTADGKVTGPVRLMEKMDVSTVKTLELAGEISGDGRLALKSGRLRLSHPNARAGETVVDGGTLEFADGGSSGTAGLTVNGGQLASSGARESVVPGPFVYNANATFETEGPLCLAGDFETASRRVFTKRGAGTLTIAGTWINPPAVSGQFKHENGTLRLAENATLELSVAATESPSESALRLQYSTDGVTPPYRAIVLEKGSRLSSGGWFFSSPNNYNPEVSGWSLFDIVVNGGLMESTGAAYGFIFGDQRAMKIHVDMHGGEIRSRPDVWSDIGTRTPVSWDVDGGAEVHLGWTAFGRQSGPGSGRVGGGVAIHVKDGLFDAGQYLSWQSTDDAKMTNVVTVGCGTRATNAVFQTVPTARPGNAGRAEFVFDGGVLRATGTATNAPGRGALNNYLNGANAVRVGPGGAGIECVEDIAIRQALEAGADGDGGVYKLGAGKATLEGSLASVTGRVDVLAGTLCGLFPNTNDLFVASGATMDLSRGSAASGWTFARVSGSGAAAGGTLTVTAELAPGDAAGETGTFRAENLTLAKGVRIPFDAGEEASDALAVTGELMLNGGVIDFGHAEGDVVALPYSGVLGTYGAIRGGTGGWSATRLGYPSTRRLSANLRADDGVLRFTVRDSGLALIFR